MLLDHVIHGRGAFVDLADLVVDSGIEKNPLGGCGFARVDMSHDPNVADLGQIEAGGGGHLGLLRCLCVDLDADYQR